MNREQIIQMAREAGIGWLERAEGISEFLEHFAKLIAEHERDACAKRLDAVGCDHCAANIRARGDQA